MAWRQEDGNEREARRLLARLAQETDGSAMTLLPREEQTGGEPTDGDWIDQTGTRIGKFLGPVLLVGCAAWVLFQLAGGG